MIWSRRRRVGDILLCFRLVAASALPCTALAQAWALPPSEIHMCDLACVTLYLTTDGRGYSSLRGVKAPPANAANGIWITRFDAGGVELVRADAPNQYFPRGLRGTIAGKLAPEGNHTVGGKITWTFGMNQAYDVELAWGPLLDTIPGSGEAPAVQAARRQQAEPPPTRKVIFRAASFGLCHATVGTADGLRLTTRFPPLSDRMSGGHTPPREDEFSGAVVKAVNSMPVTNDETLYRAARSAAFKDNPTAPFQVTLGDGSVVRMPSCVEVQESTGDTYEADQLLKPVLTLLARDLLEYDLARAHEDDDLYTETESSRAALYYEDQRLLTIEATAPDTFEFGFDVEDSIYPDVAADFGKAGLSYRLTTDDALPDSKRLLMTPPRLKPNETLRSWLQGTRLSESTLRNVIDVIRAAANEGDSAK